jgi:hypothetical protein
MDVSIVIDRDPTGSLQAELLPSSPAKSWMKVYGTKMLCLSELFALGWLTVPEFVEAQVSDFDIRGRPLIFRTHIDLDIAKAVGFVEAQARS